MSQQKTKLKLPTIKSLPTKFYDDNKELRVTEEGNPITWVDVALENYRNGGADEEFIAQIRITKEFFSQLYKDDKLFRDVVEHGRMCSYAWWLRQARTSLTTRGFNTSLWSFVMKNRFNWADKQDQTLGERELASYTKEEIDQMFDDRVEALKRFRAKQAEVQ